jgi:poly-gamma-glutamate capsule biosynthesis protein CapA/YwtB (metallophosphatase superfamily)
MSHNFTLAVTGQSLIKHDIRDNTDPAFLEVQNILAKADLAFTNFEGTILGAHGGWPLKGSFFGCSNSGVLDALKSIGFQALSLSNNHAFDLGPSGILSTLEEVEARGFLAAGIGRDHAHALIPGVQQIGQKRVALAAMDAGPGPGFMYAADASSDRPARPGVNRLGLSQIIELDSVLFDQVGAVRDKVGYSAIDLANDSQPDDAPRLVDDDEIAIARAIFKRGTSVGRRVKIDPSDMQRNRTAIAAAAAEGCLVIAYLHHHHWARDWYDVPDWVSGVAKQCIDAGAAVFVSHGAPVLQPIEMYKGRPIFYSLGNFIFHVRSEKSTWTAPEVWESVIATCSFTSDNVVDAITLHPVVIGGDAGLGNGELEQRLVPHLANGKAAQRILDRLVRQSARLGVVVEIIDDVGHIRCTANAVGADIGAQLLPATAQG